MRLEPLMTLRLDAGVPVDVGKGPFGARIISLVTGGTFEGPKLRGEIVPGGGDWILVDEDGVWHLDVRLLLDTDDGARICVQYTGVVVINERTSAALSRGETTEFGDTYFMTQPRFETGDARYTWLNRIVAVGEGRFGPGMVEYRVMAVEND